MKPRYFLTLPLAAALIVPAAVAQQSTTTNPDKQSAPASQQVSPAAQTQTAPETSNGPNTNNDANLSARQPLQPDTHEGFWGKLNPFARKKYVQRQMSPIRNRVNELDELTATNSKNIKDVDSRAQEGIRQANSKADLADQHATDAGSRAQQAQQSIQLASTRLDTVQQTIGTLDQYQPVSDTEIRFRPGQQVLSSKAKEALDQLAEQMKNQRGMIVQVQGFSSGKGSTAISNSQDMAQSVVRYLIINHEIPVYRIYTVGVGNAPVKASAEAPTKRLRGGRVEVALLKNGIADLGQSANAQNAAPSNGSTYQPNAAQGGVTGSVPGAAPATNQQPATTTQPASNVNNNNNSNSQQQIPRQ